MSETLSTGVKIRKPSSTGKKELGTRQRDLKLGKRFAFFVIVFLFIAQTSILIIARSFPESTLAVAVRALYLDETALTTPAGKNVIEIGQDLFNNIELTFSSDKEKTYASQGWHPNQKKFKYLQGMIYLGKNLYASQTPLTGKDYTENCEVSEPLAAVENKILCNSTIKASKKNADTICKMKYKGVVASGYEIMNILFKNKNISRATEKLWTRQKIDDGFLWFADSYLILDPKKLGEFIGDDESKKFAFYCVSSAPTKKGAP